MCTDAFIFYLRRDLALPSALKKILPPNLWEAIRIGVLSYSDLMGPVDFNSWEELSGTCHNGATFWTLPNIFFLLVHTACLISLLPMGKSIFRGI